MFYHHNPSRGLLWFFPWTLVVFSHKYLDLVWRLRTLSIYGEQGWCFQKFLGYNHVYEYIAASRLELAIGCFKIEFSKKNVQMLLGSIYKCAALFLMPCSTRLLLILDPILRLFSFLVLLTLVNTFIQAPYSFPDAAQDCANCAGKYFLRYCFCTFGKKKVTLSAIEYLQLNFAARMPAPLLSDFIEVALHTRCLILMWSLRIATLVHEVLGKQLHIQSTGAIRCVIVVYVLICNLALWIYVIVSTPPIRSVSIRSWMASHLPRSVFNQILDTTSAMWN